MKDWDDEIEEFKVKLEKTPVEANEKEIRAKLSENYTWNQEGVAPFEYSEPNRKELDVLSEKLEEILMKTFRPAQVKLLKIETHLLILRYDTCVSFAEKPSSTTT